MIALFLKSLGSRALRVYSWLLFSGFAYQAFACTVYDDAGTAFSSSYVTPRIVTLAPDITEMVYAIGAGNQIVGTIQSSDYPEQARHIPVVGSYLGLDQEKILSLHPTLVITWGTNFSRQLSFLAQQKIPIYVYQAHTLQDVSHTMQNLGCLLGAQQKANKAAADYDRKLATIKQRYQSSQKVTVFFQIGGTSLYTINKESWINQAIEYCGGVNIFANAGVIAPQVDMEAILSANPDFIIADDRSARWIQAWKRWSTLSAVQRSHLFSISPDLIERAGPRLADGVNILCNFLHLSA